MLSKKSAVMYFRKYKLCYPVLLIFLLTGCVSQQPIPEAEKNILWDLHSEKLAALSKWELAGRMSVQLEQEGWSAGLFWRQDNDEYRLRITAPFGRGTVEISGDADSVALRTAENQVFENNDIAELMQDKLGWEIPVTALIYWIRGLPDPGLETGLLELDDMGRITELYQSGWKVSYERYTNTPGYEVPSRLTLEREGLKLRLNITKWGIES